MTRLRSLIKEVLSQPKKKDCNCGCNDCGGKAPILTEGKVKHLISEGLQYHMDKKIQLHESVYRIGSEKHFALINEARKLWTRGLIDVSEDDQAILETHLGNFGMYKDEEVPLDMPMVNEEKDRAREIMKDLFGLDFEFDYTYKPEGNKIVIGAEGYNPDGTLFDMKDVHKEKIIRTFLDKIPNADAKPNMGGGITVHLKESLNEEVEIEKNIKDIEDGDVILYKGKKFKVDYIDPWSAGGRILNGTDLESGKKGKLKVKFVTPKGNTGTASDTMLTVLKESLNENNLLRQTNLSSEEYQKAKKLKGFNADDYTFSSDNNLYVKKSSLEERINTILEAKKKKKKKKKDPPLNKPKRGGSKAYYVYVRDPKTKKIKKVSFGSGGLRAKIKNKEARNAFAARHNCKNKKDRTKAGYWSCNLPRYADQLGLGSKMNTFW